MSNMPKYAERKARDFIPFVSLSRSLMSGFICQKLMSLIIHLMYDQWMEDRESMMHFARYFEWIYLLYWMNLVFLLEVFDTSFALSCYCLLIIYTPNHVIITSLLFLYHPTWACLVLMLLTFLMPICMYENEELKRVHFLINDMALRRMQNGHSQCLIYRKGL
ncbi:hypothetical protein BX666DRAFT_1947091 [Dichotomocladium elegans]|nr:hypothetical protein BX666DRAFT_1947091 [Dichotomocladium elegans]